MDAVMRCIQMMHFAFEICFFVPSTQTQKVLTQPYELVTLTK
jgi:hypothetical protein